MFTQWMLKMRLDEAFPCETAGVQPRGLHTGHRECHAEQPSGNKEHTRGDYVGGRFLGALVCFLDSL